MSTVDQPVKLKEREVLGKGLGNIRRDGMVPAVIHNHGQESLHVMASEADLVKVFREAGKHHPLELHVGSKRFLALIKDAQFNPVKNRMQHVVFQAIRRDEKVEAEIPVHLEGDAPAEKVGLIILHQLDTVEVEALPQDLPDALSVDATKLVELHDKLTVADITVPANVTILTELDHPIATVAETKAQMSEEAEETGDEADASEEGDGANTADDAEGKSDSRTDKSSE